MLTTGFMIFLGVALLLAKLPRRTMLRVLKHDLAAGYSRLADYPDDSLGDIQRCDGGDRRRPADQSGDVRPQAPHWLRRWRQLLPGQSPSRRVKRGDKSLLWVFLSAATGEAGRSGLRLILRHSMRLLR